MAAAPAGTVELQLRSDADCALQVGGRPAGAVQAREPRRLLLAPGTWALDCRSAEGLQGQLTLQLKAGEPAQALLRLRWAEQGEDALLDRRTGLLWTRRDAGQDLDWAGAQAWCRSLGEAWRLPSRTELEGLLSARAPGETTPCRDSQCKVSSLFRLSGYWQWSGQPDAEGRLIWYVYLHTGHTQASPPGFQLNARALCVRPGP